MSEFKHISQTPLGVILTHIILELKKAIPKIQEEAETAAKRIETLVELHKKTGVIPRG